MKIGLAIPTYNAGVNLNDVLEKIVESSINIDRKIIVDSESKDQTVAIARDKNFEIYSIQQNIFTHGLVRKKISEILADCDYIIYMTQDVYVEPTALENLVKYIVEHPMMAIAYGKQSVDMNKTDIFEKKDRSFNYPDYDMEKSYADKEQLGIKTVFSSDAFAVYRRSVLLEVNNFPEKLNFSEDMYMAAKVVKAGYTVGYCSKAIVMHSHSYTLKDQFRRYQSIGEFHGQNKWIQEEFGTNEKEGLKSVFSEWKYLIGNNKPLKIPYSIMRTGVKYLGYKSGTRKGKK
ncbi:glycosyltransferase family 2 protein [Latilactobacillus sakei]|uniref:glycosyltransferase family 2 protein n=1 Tax=Latilactobacillus sakei TaxID=1599 RepID=UPI0009765277|nr:glycosyltransferase [Latilactobacillus sakei]